MELKPGYKQSGVGAFPTDWDIAKLGTRATFRTGPFGSTLHKSDYIRDGVPVINPMHIVDSALQPSASMSVSESAASRLAEFQLRASDIIMGRRGDMGRCAVVAPEQAGWLCGTGSVIIRTKDDTDPHYLQRVLSSSAVVSALKDASVGTTMTNLNHSTLASLALVFPRPEEQVAIAGALSDVDGLIGALDRLIAKKRDLKQAAMQQLLTGRTRLPGFKGKWESKRLGDVADTDPENLGASTPRDLLFNYVALEDVDRGTLRSFSEQVLRSAPSRARRNLRDGDVLVSTVRPNLQSHLLFHSMPGVWVCSTGFCVIRCRENVTHPAFICSHFFGHEFNRQIDALLTGSNYPAINSADVRALSMMLPPFEEQAAIAQVLTDMDAEIAALESRRDKTRLLKQGMMQELLTGRVRLPLAGSPEGATDG